MEMERRAFFATLAAIPLAVLARLNPLKRTRKVFTHQAGMVGYKGWENDLHMKSVSFDSIWEMIDQFERDGVKFK